MSATAKISTVELTQNDQLDIWISGGRGNLKILSTINISVNAQGKVEIKYTGDNVVMSQDIAHKG